MQSGAAEIAVDQQDPPAGVGVADRQVARRGRFAIPGVRTRHHDDLETLIAAQEVDVGADRPVRLGPVRPGLGVADQADGAHEGGLIGGHLTNFAEHRQAHRLAKLSQGADPLVEAVEEEDGPHPEHAARDQRQGQGQDGPGPDRIAEGMGRLDDLRGDAGEITDELGLLELIDHRAEEGPLAFQLASQILFGQQVDLDLLGLLLRLVELRAQILAHRLDRLEAPCDRREHVLELARLQTAPGIPAALADPIDLKFELLDLRIVRPVPLDQLLLFDERAGGSSLLPRSATSPLSQGPAGCSGPRPPG